MSTASYPDSAGALLRRGVRASVIIPCFNAACWLPDTLEAMTRQKLEAPWEILVVDNGSTDHSRTMAESFVARLPNLRVIEAAAHHGPGYARNVGVSEAHGEFILFCDADDIPADDWVAQMLRALEKNPFVGCRLEHTRLNPEWLRTSRHGVQSTGLVPFPWLDAAGGGTLGIRRDIFLAVGGFDEDLRTHEDIDLCWRVQLAGTPLRFARDAVIHYRYRGSLRGTFQQARRYGFDRMALIHRYRARGHRVPSKTWRGFALECAGMLAHLPMAARHRASLAAWLSDFGFRVGMLSRSLHA